MSGSVQAVVMNIEENYRKKLHVVCTFRFSMKHKAYL